MTTKKIAFTEFERRLLQNLVERYRLPIEEKRTDSSSIFHKRNAWQMLTADYNASAARRRQTHQLKRLWENMKARAKRNITVGLSAITRGSEKQSHNDNAAVDGNNMEGHLWKSCNQSNTFEFQASHQSSEEFQTPVTAKNGYNVSARFKDRLEQICFPIIKIRLRKNREAVEQQKQMHLLEKEREHIRVVALEEQLNRDRELHALHVIREKELHELKLKQEMELHAQKMRLQEELHRRKLADYR